MRAYAALVVVVDGVAVVDGLSGILCFFLLVCDFPPFYACTSNREIAQMTHTVHAQWLLKRRSRQPIGVVLCLVRQR
jgi:hypothetical protein